MLAPTPRDMNNMMHPMTTALKYFISLSLAGRGFEPAARQEHPRVTALLPGATLVRQKLGSRNVESTAGHSPT